MILTKATIEIQREKKTKLRGEFVDMFHPVLSLEAGIEKNEMGTVFSFIGPIDIQRKDRVKYKSAILDIEQVLLSNAIETKAIGIVNEFESSLQELTDAGADIQYGFIETTGKDHDAEEFMDAWVGTYIKNIVDHYEEIKMGRDISSLSGLFNHDMPVACVGAGPSLDKNVEHLKDFPGIIIVTDKAYKMLLAHGVEPDLVVSVDCHYDLIPAMLKYGGSHRHTLVLNTCADPAASRNWKGKIFWYLMRHPGVQFTDKILPALFPTFGGIENTGNVGNTSVLLAEMIGLGPIYLVGHDYSYTGKKMFAQRYEFDENGENPKKIEDNHETLFQERTGKVDVDGITTYAPFLVYRDTLYALNKKRDIAIVNCTEGGILTQLPCRPLLETIQDLKKRDNIPNAGDFRAAKNRIRNA